MDFADKIDRAVLGFLVDAEDIFADDTEEDQLNGAQEIEAKQGRGPTDKRQSQDFINEYIDACQHKNEGTNGSQPEA